MKDQLKFVQILRGFAAIAVLLSYLNISTLTYFRHALFNFEIGYLGIDFFFALTGFIITYVHLREIQHRSNVKKFLLKRFVRIYPFYWLVLLVVIGLQSPDFPEKPTLQSAIDPTTADGWMTIIKNIFLYPLPDTHMPVGIAWALPYAIVFYILFALCIRLGWKAARYIFIGWLLLILLYPLNVFPHLLLVKVTAGTMNIQILIGCLAGYLFVKNKVQLKTSHFISILIVIAILFTVFVYWQGFDRNNILATILIGSASSLLLFYAASLDRQKRNKNYASKLLVLIGDASYSIFFTHILFIPYICIAFNKVLNVPVIPVLFKNVLIIFAFVLTIIAGILVYLIIERPMLNFLRNKFRLKRQKKSWL